MEQYRGAYEQGLLAQPMDMASFNPYSPLAAGLMLAPGSGFADVAGYAPSMTTAGLRRTYDIGRKAQFMRPDVVDPQMEFIEAQKQMLRNQGILY